MTVAPKVWSARPEPGDSDAGDEVLHVVCCADDDLALCGTDVTGAQWHGDQDCVVCVDLDRISRFCPKLERCSPVRRVSAFIRRRGR